MPPPFLGMRSKQIITHIPQPSGIGELYGAGTAPPDFGMPFGSPQYREGRLVAYHNDHAVKAKFVARMKAHADANDVVRRVYWKNGMGCAVGCTVHSDSYAAYEAELGWPEWLAHLKETVFENMTEDAATLFPLQLLEAVPAGFSDWGALYHDFCAFVLRNLCWMDPKAHPEADGAVNEIIRLHETRSANASEWLAAWSDACKAKPAMWAAKAAAVSAEVNSRNAGYVAFATTLSVAVATVKRIDAETYSGFEPSTAHGWPDSSDYLCGEARKERKLANTLPKINDCMGRWLIRRLSSTNGCTGTS